MKDVPGRQFKQAMHERSMRILGKGMMSVWMLAGAFGIWGASCEAAQTSAGVGVNVTLQTSNGIPSAGTCTYVAAFGTAVLVSCTPGDLRFLTPSARTEPLLLVSPVNEESPLIRRLDTSWRKVMVDNLEYIEIMVRW